MDRRSEPLRLDGLNTAWRLALIECVEADCDPHCDQPTRSSRLPFSVRSFREDRETAGH
jgi:hypothetical protein